MLRGMKPREKCMKRNVSYICIHDNPYIYIMYNTRKNRKSPRKIWYDYTTPWAYFVTICTKHRKHYFGKVINGEMVLSELGKICQKYIHQIESNRKNIRIKEYVVMPNHVHMILVLEEWDKKRNDPTVKNNRRDASTMHPGRNNTIWTSLLIQMKDGLLNRPYSWPVLWNVIKIFKWNVTKYANQHNNTFTRQSRYHDNIITTQRAYINIQRYIKDNPKNRKEDRFHI